jgi:transglutaminase-like putative cysteine protease
VWFSRAAGPPPPALPGQRVDVIADLEGWTVTFDADADVDAGAVAALPPGRSGPDRTPELRALARRVADEIEDDLGTTALTEGGARVARRGDCTTHALRFAALAADRGLDTRVVTGLRLDGDALVRHRWIVAWTGRRWIAIDPTYAEAPAAPVLVGLAVHGPRAADLALADAVVFDQLGDRALAVP